jgi:hypothetical protein
MSDAIFRLWLGWKKIEFSRLEIEEDKRMGGTLEADLVELQRQADTNPIQFFKPHGTAKYVADGGFNTVSALEYLNDDEHTLCLNVSANQTGKTCLSVVRKVLKIVPNNPSWMLFREHKVRKREWTGPKTLVCMGYDKGQLQDVMWPELQKWIPDEELGDFRSFRNGGTREPSWLNYPRVTLKCGSRIIFITYEMKASVCAGIKASEVLADEQPPASFFNELDQRGRTLGGICWDIACTPHKVEGRPDTGTNNWIYSVWKGEDTKGHKVLRTRISVEDVPDHIYSDAEKRKAYQQWVVIPRKKNDEEAIREGEARYYGMFQRPAGLFYGEVKPELHFIDWTYDDIKDKPVTLYRSIDYGYASPTCCGYWAVFSTGEYFLYDIYYVPKKDAIPHARAIIEQSGNKVSFLKKELDKKTNILYDVLIEEEIKCRFRWTVLDWHCFEQQGGAGQSIAFFFRIGGLKVIPSTTLQQEQRAHATRSFLRIDSQRTHLVTGKKGAPRMYISRRCQPWIWEWERCVFESRRLNDTVHGPKETHIDKDDHAIDMTEYIACSGARFLPKNSPGNMQVPAPLSSDGGY